MSSAGGAAGLTKLPNGGLNNHESSKKSSNSRSTSSNGGWFQMPLHYPKFKKEDYEKMPEWKLDCLLKEYGLPMHVHGDVLQKRKFAMGAFLWPDQIDAA